MTDKKIINDLDANKLQSEFLNATPFPHIVIDDFFTEKYAENIAKEFPDFDDERWYFYNNPIEHKKAMNHWDRFPKYTYQAFSYLNSQDFIQKTKELTRIDNLEPDVGLNGGGWHIHGRGGKLNVHLDYSIHPKLMLERRLNIIIYMCSKDWQDSWGGQLGLWSHDEKNNKPKEMIKKVTPKFNRAVLFDTTCNSWHGLPEELNCPENEYRKSLAVYYLSEPRKGVSTRGKALFAPSKGQENDQEVLDLIKVRSNIKGASSVYNKNKNDQ